MQNDQGGSNKGKSLTRKILWAVAVIALAAAVFFAGFFTYRLTLEGGLQSLLWFKSEIEDHYYEDISEDEFWQAAINGVESILDDYSAYYTSEEFEALLDENEGVRADIGASFFTNTNKIVRVAIGSPLFYTAQAQSGMFLTGVGDSAETLQDTFDAAALDKALAQYKDGDSVCLRLSSVSASDTEHCTYAVITVREYVESCLLYAAGGKAYAAIYSDANGQGEWTDVSEYVDVDELFTGSTAYIKLIRFRGAAADDFDRAVQQYRQDGATALLLDLRNNGGGEVAIMQRIASHLMKDAEEARPVVMTAEYKSGTRELFRAVGNTYADTFADSKIYVAANMNSASASEALMGVMLSYGTIGYGDIFITDTTGTGNASTYGKGIMQSTYQNPVLGEAVSLTTALCYWPNGTCIHGVGIRTADGTRISPAQTFADYNDPELNYIVGQIS